MATNITHHAVGVTWVEDSAMARAAHAVRDDGHVWLIDPFDDTAALAAAADLGDPVGVIQLLDRHNRDGQAIAQGLGVPLLRLPVQVAGSPFEVISVVSQRWWKELALWWEAERTLIVAEAVGTASAFALGRRLGVHPMLRLTPPKVLGSYRPERVLVGHGVPVQEGGAAALNEALSGSRGDIPKLVLKLPSLIRGG
ncbi:MAG TPA: hypothetical protein VG223_17250 [Solirubrobacteraceae bacterium]|jgi:hypothetical protein|nr:hypothetical protein [Solirubrobacteraceae bacterium]